MTTVRVYCRMRPFNKREIGLGHLDIPILVSKNDISIPDRKKKYNFDYNFDDSATQEQVFNIVGRAVIQDFMDGFNATQFVYGQTGAGKSWTMMGKKDSEELSGMIPRSSALMFQNIEDKPQGWKFEIEASYLEIYMEKVNDLLDPDKTNLDVKEGKDHGVYVQGLTRETLSCLEEVYSIIDEGDKIRKVAATKMNEGSSRSHSVLSIYLIQTDPEGRKLSSQLNMVDLAGSERIDKTGATGDVLKQGATINLSLTILSQVISGLSDLADLAPGKAPPVVPYRSSKLTRLLQTSLGGNAKTGLSVHISPHIDNIEETISTLEFGKRAKKIKNNAKAKIQRSAEQLEIELEKLQAAYDKLKKAFQELSGGRLPPGLDVDGGGGGAVSSEELIAEQAKVRELEAETEQVKSENNNLKDEIAKLEEELQKQHRGLDEARRDYDVKDLEVKALQTKLRELGQVEEDLDYGDEDTTPRATSTGVLTTNTVGGFKGSNPKHNAELAELKGLVTKQKDMLNRVRAENKDLKQENVELADKLEESTRRLALAELQVIRYEQARKRSKDKKIAVKITPGKGKPSPIWRNLLMDRGPSATNVAEKPKVDYERRRRGTVLEKLGGLFPVPLDQLAGGREGPLEERLYQKTQFVRRWFVLRDSFLFCFENQDAPISEPRFCIPLADAKIGSCPKQGDQEFCFMILCGTYFSVMAASTDSEKTVWLKDLNYAKFITHANLMQTAYFNRCAVDAVQDPGEFESLRARVENSPYHSLGESDYVQQVSVCGGIEGFLTSPGFKMTDPSQNSMFSRELRKGWKSFFVVVKDSHLLLYDLVDHSELLTEPKGVLYLGTNIAVLKQHEETDDPDDPNDTTPVRFYFTVLNRDNESQAVALCAPSESERDRWMLVLNAATKVTTRNVMLAALDKEAVSVSAGINPQEVDLQDRFLDPLCVQPYDDKSKPLYRHPDGRTMTRDLVPVGNDTKRFSKTGQPVDFYNRPMPLNAAPMFAKDPVEPIGVGVDGKHYAYPSGREFEPTDPHYDVEGQPLHVDTVKAADNIVTQLKIACIARSAILNRDKTAVYDAFGRPLKKCRDGSLRTLEGEPLGRGAAVFDGLGSRIKWSPAESGAIKTLEISYLNNDNKVMPIGKLGIEVAHTTLADVHAEIKKNLPKISSTSFLHKGMPISDNEREQRYASDYLPRIIVSCRDTHGKRMQFEEKPFVADINHAELDDARSKEMENDFIKMVTNQKAKRSSRAGSRASLTSPRTPRT